MLPRLRLRCSGNALRDLVPAYVNLSRLFMNTKQISRNALASGLCDDCSNRGLAPSG